jgi:hypothetical protein
MSSAVRQTPLTEIESPCFVSSVTVRASITMRAFSPFGSTLLTLPSSSMIPVNITIVTQTVSLRTVDQKPGQNKTVSLPSAQQTNSLLYN